jgi:hypothetical protein
MSTSTPVPAEEPQTSAAVPAGPRGGRGRQLTARQEAKLIELCEQQNLRGRYADEPKAFWRWISEHFKHQTGRDYSWQSCRRRMTKFEDEARPQHPHSPSPIPSVEAGPSRVEQPETTPDYDDASDASGHGHDDEDDDLPPISVPVVRSTNPPAGYDPENDADLLCYKRTINEAVAHLAMCLSLYGRKIIEDRDDLRNVYEALDRFHEEYKKAVAKGNRGQEGGRR